MYAIETLPEEESAGAEYLAEPAEGLLLYGFDPLVLSASALMRLRKHNLAVVEDLLGSPDTSSDTDAAEVIILDDYRPKAPSPKRSTEGGLSFYEQDARKVKAARENERCFEELYKEYAWFLRVKASDYFLKGGEAEDLLQEALFGFYKAIRDYDPSQSSFKTFLELCVSRQIITAVKTADRFKHGPLNDYMSFEHTTSPEGGNPDSDLTLGNTLPHPGLQVDEDVIGKEGIQYLVRTLATSLSALEADCLRLFLEGDSYIQMADELGCGTKTIDNALQRVKRKILDAQANEDFESPLTRGMSRF